MGGKMKYKIGFTSVELLTVIVIVAIFSLGAIFGVNYLLTETKKEAFSKDVSNIVQSTSVAYAALNLEESACFNYEYLKKNKFYIGSENYIGSILVTKTDTELKYSIWMTNEEFGFSKYTLGTDLKVDKKYIEDNKVASKTCNSFSGKIYE